MVFYGGVAGGGKSWAAVADVMRWMGVPGYKALMVRRTFPELMGADGLFDIAVEMSKDVPGIRVVHGNKPEISIPAIGSRILFRHMQYEKSKKLHQGAQYAVISADEVTGLSDTQWWYLMSRNRSRCGVKPYMRAMCNPEPGWVADLLSWWIGSDGLVLPERSGVIRWMRRDGDGEIVWSDTKDHSSAKSFTFIMARLEDNKYLAEDGQYAATLDMLDRLEYERLALGNWHAMPRAGDYFQREWCDVIYEEPAEGVVWARGWDKAASEDPKADWTVGVRMGRVVKTGQYILDVRSVEREQLGPAGVLELMAETAEEDGIETMVGGWQDPAQAGKVDVAVTESALRKFHFRAIPASKSKLSYWKPFARAAKRGKITLLRRRNHRERNAGVFLGWLEAQGGTDVKHDDDMDAVAGAFQHVHNVGKLSYRTARPERDSRFMLD